VVLGNYIYGGNIMGLQQTRKFYEDRERRLNEFLKYENSLLREEEKIKKRIHGKFCTCEECGSQIYKHNSKLERNTKFFCSKLCYMTFLKHKKKQSINFEKMER